MYTCNKCNKIAKVQKFTDEKAKINYYRVYCNCGENSGLHLSSQKAVDTWQRMEKITVFKNFRIPRKTDQKLVKRADELGQSQTEYLCDALDHYDEYLKG